MAVSGTTVITSCPAIFVQRVSEKKMDPKDINTSTRRTLPYRELFLFHEHPSLYMWNELHVFYWC